MYPNVLAFVERVLTADLVTGRDVLEVGSYDVNGSVRPYLESLKPASYWGVDVAAGPSVDQVIDCTKLTDHLPGNWPVVVSTEMLEHVRDWQRCVQQLVAVTAPGGVLLITTCSPGFPFHPFPEDHWRFTPTDMAAIAAVTGVQLVELQADLNNLGVFMLVRKPQDWVPRQGLDDLTVAGVAA